jgi:hypothetical protein
MAETYVAIQKSTIGTAVSSVTLSAIPATYTDLILVINAPSLGGGNNSAGLRFECNGDTATNYSTTLLNSDSTGTPVSTREQTQTRGRLGFLGQTADRASVSVSHFMQYANTGVYKTVFGRSATASSNNDANVYAGVSMWRGLTAINAIKITLSDNSNMPVGTTFNLYGVLAGAATFTGTTKATGGTITKDSFGYVYHTFTSTNTFTPSSTISNAEILTVAGGGSGGWPYSGGGGGGGVLYTSGLTLANGVALTCSVGGGASGSYGALGQKGTNSTVTGSGFTTLTATGGGAGIARNTFTGGEQNGGSGGGGGAVVNVGGTGIAGQGYAGGGSSGTSGGGENGGGGGGAGSNGATATTSGAGNGGAGTNLFANWAITTGTGSNQCYGGGGGGGTNENTFGAGGIGGGGRGAANNTSTESQAGTANTGGGSGGGGAGNTPSSPKNGGSGIVIIRYLGV